ncbi:MAG: hypothetical protein LBK94_04615 [Prevotellaceae bacterium]|jgi:hypothetical protein|nr:hypothetical protein [Prevotellaceae bacterium]
MKTFNNRLQAFWIYAGKQGKTVPAMSGFVHPRQMHKFLFNGLLHGRPFCRVDKTRQSVFYLSEIARLLSNIVCISILYTSNGHATFAVDKVHIK